MLEEIVQDRDKLGLVRRNILLVQTINDSINSTDAGLDDIECRAFLLAFVLLHGTGQVLEEQWHKASVLGTEVFNEILCETSDSVQ